MNQARNVQEPQNNTFSFDHDDSVVLRLDQLETPGKCSVIYEIARIDTLLGQVFMKDLRGRLIASA